jgi:hypothetical protein
LKQLQSAKISGNQRESERISGNQEIKKIQLETTGISGRNQLGISGYQRE